MIRLLYLVLFWSELACGNYLFQVFTGWHRWDTATERSYFEAVALFSWWALTTIQRWVGDFSWEKM